jgi:peptidoglycan/LPS O-acetylase OafA/YrhL
MRGLAAFGVIFIHVGLVSPIPLSPGVLVVQNDFFGLTCVSFFLAAAFYFAALTTPPGEPFLPWLKRRAGRILIPYALWSIIYTLLQVIEVMLRPDKAAGLHELFADPIGRILFGGSGVALYFLPLLFVGLVAMKLLTTTFARRPLVVLVIGLVAALLLDHFCNSESLLSAHRTIQPLLAHVLGDQSAAFWANSPPMRIILGILGLVQRCLPYLFLGWICAAQGPALLSTRIGQISAGAISLAILLLATWSILPIPESLDGFSVLLLALVLPVPDRLPWAERLGRYSFGIYLVHQVILEAFKLALHNHPPLIDLKVAFPITATTFALATLLVYLAENYGAKPGRTLMALPEPKKK